MPDQYSMQVVEESKKCQTISLLENGNGPLSLIQASEFNVNFRVMSRFIPMKMISLYQPKTGIFFWWLSNLGSIISNIEAFLNHYFVYFGNNKITCFLLSGIRLYCRESTEQYNTFEEAHQTLIDRLSKNVKEICLLSYIKWFRVVHLAKYIDRYSFLEQKTSGNLFTPPLQQYGAVKMVEIRRHNDTWQIELEGACNRKATVIIKDDYNNEKEPELLSDDYYEHRVVMAIDDYEVLDVFGDCVKPNPVKMWKKGSESIIHGAENYPDHPFVKRYHEQRETLV